MGRVKAFGRPGGIDMTTSARRQRVCILGSTGSIGTSTLDVLALHPDTFEVFALTGQRRGHVTLGVAGADQDQGYGDEAPVAAVVELGDGVGHQRRRQLEEAAGDVERRDLGHQVDEGAELRHAVVALGAVADDDQARTRAHAGCPK